MAATLSAAASATATSASVSLLLSGRPVSRVASSAQLTPAKRFQSARRSLASTESSATLWTDKEKKVGAASGPSEGASSSTGEDTSTSNSTGPSSTSEADVDAVTKKWGLEAGLWKALRSKPEEPAPTGEARQGDGGAGQGKSNTELAKELLGKYGAAYLVTSISLALISFSFFYVLVDTGVDVPSLLQQLGISVDSTGQKVGTVALAYAAHKAASPIRFPPTVLLTPIVANFFGKNKQSRDKSK